MLTEAQIAELRPKWNEYPERRVLVPTYPAARKKRGLSKDEQAALPADEQGALPTDGLSGVPTTRLWSVALFSNSVGVSIQRGSPSFAGPALIHSFTGVIRAHDSGSIVYPAQMAFSDNPYPDTDVGTSQAKLPGTHITFNATPYSNATRTALHTEGFLADQSTALAFYPIGIYVKLDRFYLGLLIQGTIAGQASIYGTLRIIEHAPKESIAWI